jgi:centractin
MSGYAGDQEIGVEDLITSQPVVIDNGTGCVKAGFAGDDRPKCEIRNYVGVPKHEKCMVRSLDGEFFVGKKAQDNRGILRLRRPMTHGVIKDWDDMEKVWTHIYDKANLNVSSEEHPVLLTEPPVNPRQNCEKALQVFFETFHAPAMFISPTATLSLYASGRTTGVVLDSGDGITHAVPVYEGYAIPHATVRADFGGRDVTNHLQLLLRKSGHLFHTSAESEVVREIKEAKCYVTYDPDKEEQLEMEQGKTYAMHTLPDGNNITIGAERYRAPEIIFKPHLIGLEYPGIHQVLINSIRKTDLDLRSTFYKQIILAGGTTLFTGFGERLLNEIRKLAPKKIKIRISAPTDRATTCWAGGSILASLATFKSMWMRRDEYEEHGHLKKVTDSMKSLNYVYS